MLFAIGIEDHPQGCQRCSGEPLIQKRRVALSTQGTIYGVLKEIQMIVFRLFCAQQSQRALSSAELLTSILGLKGRTHRTTGKCNFALILAYLCDATMNTLFDVGGSLGGSLTAIVLSMLQSHTATSTWLHLPPISCEEEWFRPGAPPSRSLGQVFHESVSCEKPQFPSHPTLKALKPTQSRPKTHNTQDSLKHVTHVTISYVKPQSVFNLSLKAGEINPPETRGSATLASESAARYHRIASRSFHSSHPLRLALGLDVW